MNRETLFNVLKEQFDMGPINFEPSRMAKLLNDYLSRMPAYAPISSVHYKKITKAVFHACSVVNCEINDVYSKSQKSPHVHARFFVCYYCYYTLDMSFEDIANEFDKNHSTMSIGFRSFEAKPPHDHYKKLFKRFQKRINLDPDL